eukprot:s640_g7.t1
MLLFLPTCLELARNYTAEHNAAYVAKPVSDEILSLCQGPSTLRASCPKETKKETQKNFHVAHVVWVHFVSLCLVLLHGPNVPRMYFFVEERTKLLHSMSQMSLASLSTSGSSKGVMSSDSLSPLSEAEMFDQACVLAVLFTALKHPGQYQYKSKRIGQMPVMICHARPGLAARDAYSILMHTDA